MNKETPFIKLDVLGETFLKMENLCFSKSHKHRLAEKHFLNAIKLGFSKITVGSCGNYGYSVLMFSRKYKFKTRIFLPKKFYTQNLLVNNFNCFIDYKETYEDCVAASINFAKENSDYYDANCFGHHNHVSFFAYDELAKSIANKLSNKEIKDYILWVPVGNGLTLTSLYRWFQSNSSPIQFGIVGSRGNSSPIESMKSGTVKSISKKKIKLSEYNQPLVNYEPVPNTDELIKISQNNIVIEVLDKDIKKTYDYLNNKIKVSQKSGCAALAGCFKYKKSNKNIVLITS